MRIFEYDSKLYLQFKLLSQPEILHFISTKKGWGEQVKCRFTGDSPTSYQFFRKELARVFKLETTQLIFPRQVHSSTVAVIDRPMQSADIPETDALITNQPGLCLCVQTADCVPILLFDPVNKVIGSVHAGWRGTVNKILAKTIFAMQQRFDTQPENLIAGIGPSIHLHAYEVGQDVILPVRENFNNHRHLLKPSSTENKAYFDLWEANKTILTEIGLEEKQIEVMGICSYSHESLFYSARRDGIHTGRMVSGIMLK